MKKKLAAIILALALCLSLAACGGSDTEVTATIVNRTGVTIGNVCISPASSDSWGDGLLSGELADGAMTTVSIGSFSEKELEAGFNIIVYDDMNLAIYDDSFSTDPCFFDSGNYLIFMPADMTSVMYIDTGYDAAEYDGYLAEAGFGPVEETGLSDFTGVWKYSDYDVYLFINDDLTYEVRDSAGSTAGPFSYYAVDDGIMLCLEEDTDYTVLSFNADGTLSDSEGDILVPGEYVEPAGALPSKNDPLDATLIMPGTSISISYPSSTMTGAQHPNIENSLSFNAINEDGTDDYYSNILFSLLKIDGYDDYLSRGYATAKEYMQRMLFDAINSMYPDKLLKSIATDCVDGGWYYGITGFVWLDGSVFANAPSQPVRATFEIRYVGPTGYALVTSVISLENRIQNYYDIACNMLATATYGGDWSTAPKPVPASRPAGSDSGDYGTPYYWYDSDGDVWYWNGYEDVFIGYGDSYYIDDDGQYYESNDAGWDDDAWYDDGYGDYFDYEDDYDPWSDPGDYYDGYDDGWGDYFD